MQNEGARTFCGAATGARNGEKAGQESPCNVLMGGAPAPPQVSLPLVEAADSDDASAKCPWRGCGANSENGPDDWR